MIRILLTRGVFWAALLPIAAVAQEDRTEPALWQRIQKLQNADRGETVGAAWYEAASTNRTKLLETIRLSQTLYPGGAHRDELIAIELQTRFELAVLNNGDFSSLIKRLAQLNKQSPSRFVEMEAAYWQMRLAAFDVQQPLTTATFTQKPIDSRQASQAFAQKYPQSRRVPRLVNDLFRAMEADGDVAELRALVEILKQHHPDHGITRELTARIALHQQIGSPFDLAFIGLKKSERFSQPRVVCIFDDRVPGRVGMMKQINDAAKESNYAVQVEVLFEDPAAAEQDRSVEAALRERGVVDLPLFMQIDADGTLRRIGNGACLAAFINGLATSQAAARTASQPVRPTKRN